MVDRLCGLEIDHEFKVGWLLHRHIGRLGATQDLGYLPHPLTVDLRKTWTVAYQTAFFRRIWPLINRSKRSAAMRSRIRPRLVSSSGIARKLMASTASAFASSSAVTISSGLAKVKANSSTRRERAGSCCCCRCRFGAMVESASAAIRRTPGTASIRIS